MWVPKRPIALWSTPGTKFTEGLWDIGIIIEKEKDGNIKVLVNGMVKVMEKVLGSKGAIIIRVLKAIGVRRGK